MAALSNIEPFLPFPGEPTTSYELWKTSVQAAILQKGFHIQRLPPKDIISAAGVRAQQAHDYSDYEKNIDVFMVLGLEGQRRYHGTPQASNFNRSHAEFWKVIDSLFEIPVSRHIALCKFRQRFQKEGESALLFASELRSLARFC